MIKNQEKPIHPEIVKIFLDKNNMDDLEKNLDYGTTVDQAHLIMLMEENIVPKDKVIKILKEIKSLQKSRYRSLKNKKAQRGWYILYENELIKKLGSDVGGCLHTGRSRNDLYATMFRLKLREPFKKLGELSLDLNDTILKSSKKYKDIIIPLHTQMQPAVPSTYGHYLLGIANSLNRDIENLLNAFNEIDFSPLGAGAVGGTSIPINPKRTAMLLGFKKTNDISIDSIASYNYVLNILAALSILNVTISRFGEDLHNWSTKEFDFIEMSKNLTGKSSMMPQKSNPFVIEHIKGIASSNAGYLLSSISTMQKTSFSNAIEVKKDATKSLFPSIKDTIDLLKILKIVVEGIKPKKNIMDKNYYYSFTAATYLSEKLVLKNYYSFREAYNLVGSIVQEALSEEKPFKDICEIRLKDKLGKEDLSEILDYSNIVKNTKYGGGPGGNSFNRIFNSIKKDIENLRNIITEKEKNWKESDKNLSNIVSKYLKK